MYAWGNPLVLLLILLTQSLLARANSSKRPLKWWSWPPVQTVFYPLLVVSQRRFCPISWPMEHGVLLAVAVPPAMSLSDDGGKGTEVQAASCITIC